MGVDTGSWRIRIRHPFCRLRLEIVRLELSETPPEGDFLICTAPNPAEGVRPCRLAWSAPLTGNVRRGFEIVGGGRKIARKFEELEASSARAQDPEVGLQLAADDHRATVRRELGRACEVDGAGVCVCQVEPCGRSGPTSWSDHRNRVRTGRKLREGARAPARVDCDDRCA